MFRLVLASHGKLAEGMKHSAEMIVGHKDELHTICAYVEEAVTLENQIREMFEKFDETDQIVVVTDILGGSVNNEFMGYLRKRHFWLITGMNLPLVVQLAMIHEEDNLKEEIKDAVENGQQMVCLCNSLLTEERKEQEEF